MTRRLLVGILASGAIVVAVILGILGRHGTSAPAVSAAPAPFSWLAQTAPPAGWSRINGSSSVSPLLVPPGFRSVPGDPGTLTAALFAPGGAYLGYLNATPLQGGEQLRGWPEFRLEHLRDDDARSARQDAAVQLLHIRAGLRSCVIDDYVTRAGGHHYHEVACLVMQRATGSVVVAATPSGDPAHVWAALERAVASYPVT